MGEKAVDAGGIGVEHAFELRRQLRILLLGRAIEAEDAHEPVGRQGRGAEPFREASGASPAHQIHLKKTVLRMDEAQGEGSVALSGGADGGNAARIAMDVHLGAQARDREPSVIARQRRAQPEKARGENDERQQQKAEEESPHPAGPPML